MNNQKNKYREKPIPEEKINAVKEIAKKMKESKSVVIVSIGNVPSKQLQQISKQLRDKAEIKVIKKSIFMRALEKAGDENLKKLENYLQENIAFLFSNSDPFELATILTKNKSRAKAKEGQKVNEDVVVEAGPTEMTPGPVISELGDMGIPFEIKEGKINIQENKKILSEGEEAGPGEVSIMTKLDITPVEIKLNPIVAYESEEEKIFQEIDVDSEKAVEDLKDKYGRALAFAVSITHSCKETIGHILAKAASHEKALESKLDVSDKGEKNEGSEEDNKGKDDKEKSGEEKANDEGEEKKEEEKSEKEGDDGENEEEGKGNENDENEDQTNKSNNKEE